MHECGERCFKFVRRLHFVATHGCIIVVTFDEHSDRCDISSIEDDIDSLENESFSQLDVSLLFLLLKEGSYTELLRVRTFVRVYKQSHWLIQSHI